MKFDCSKCKYQGVEEVCEECSASDIDGCCSCHLNPPCGYCTDSKFEEKDLKKPSQLEILEGQAADMKQMLDEVYDFVMLRIDPIEEWFHRRDLLREKLRKFLLK